ncbi:MAG: tetratricopeptide repeat protein [Pyrinomonadaceae bacterium]
MNNLKLFLRVYGRPGAAVSDLMDRGSWAFSVALVVVVSAAFSFTVNRQLDAAYKLNDLADLVAAEQVAGGPAEASAAKREDAAAGPNTAEAARPRIPFVGDAFFVYFTFEPAEMLRPLIGVSIFFLPLCVFLLSLVSKIGSYGDVIAREYGTLATCTLTMWAAAHLPFAIAAAALILSGAAVDPIVYLTMWAASGLLFAFFSVFVLRTALGASLRTAVPVVAVGSVAFCLAHFVFAFVPAVFFMPLIVLYAFVYFRGSVDAQFSEFKKSVLPRQNYKRLLHEIATNPSNADAHVQLAHVYRFRHQQRKALEHLKKALEIDPREIEANYELGRMARVGGDLQKALDHFSIVVEQDDTHSLNEIWREIGATYLAASMFSEAREALERFKLRRPFDAEGLYYLGKAIKGEGRQDAARELFEQAVESVKVSPAYRRRYVQRWGELAQKEI